MSSAASDPVLIGIDWGTSSFRAILIGAQGAVVDHMSSSMGIMSVGDGDFEAVFHCQLSPWIETYDLPVIASGMITSRNGWVETPYADTPAGAKALAQALVPFHTSSGITVHFVPGIKTQHDGAPDVMRGEETQIIGAATSGLSDGLFAMPGTHSKWVAVQEGQITDFATYMTGELFAALCDHTILRTLMNEGPFHEKGFRMGVASGLEAGADLLHRLFHVRTLPLFEKISEEMTADYLSGLLIGTEIRAATQHSAINGSIILVGRGDLADRYQRALAIHGLESQQAPDDIVARGHFVIAKSAGLLS